jgi:hypothetical protein
MPADKNIPGGVLVWQSNQKVMVDAQKTPSDVDRSRCKLPSYRTGDSNAARSSSLKRTLLYSQKDENPLLLKYSPFLNKSMARNKMQFP